MRMNRMVAVFGRRGVRPGPRAALGAGLAIGFALIGAAASAQPFSSGSTGADGALNLTGDPGTVIDFDPASFTPPLDPERDNVYHFTTITISAGVRVRLTAEFLNGPVFWLAQGPVVIDGVIDLDGGPGHPLPVVLGLAMPSIPGAGGYRGGITAPHVNGGGPSGGGTCNSGGFSGNAFLVPLVGGSGGGAAPSGVCGSGGGGGGAGGGAILIASSASITINGTGIITALGGGAGRCSSCGETGGRGAIRLVASSIVHTGTLRAAGVRLEAFERSITGGISATHFNTQASPVGVFLPPPTASALASLRVVSVAGVPVPTDPTASFTTPDVTFNSGVPVNVVIEGRSIRLGTRVTVRVFSEDGGFQDVQSSGLEGTFAQSTATATVGFPSGFSRAYVLTTWQP